MSSTFYNDHHHHPHHPKRELNDNNSGILYPPPSLSPSPSSSPSPTVKVNKDSHVIKKQSSPSSSSSTAKPRHPVIIYTHNPKVIHTNPKDFMALVQKLTGMPRSDEDSVANVTTDRGGNSVNRSVSDHTGERKINRNRCGGGHSNYHRKGIFFNNAMISEDSETSSVITTDENIGEHGQVISSLPYQAVAIPPPPPPPPSKYDATRINYGAYLPAFPMPPPTNPTGNYIYSDQLFASLDDTLIYASNMRSSFSSSSSSVFDGFSSEFRDP